MYDVKRANRYWSKRVTEVDSLAAVLVYNAPGYINESYSLWELSSLFKNLPKDLAGLRVLDISCGVGRISIPLAKKGAEVTGIDISEGMLKACKRNIRAQGLDSRIKLYQCNAVDISVAPSEHFDIVLCLGLLEHLLEPLREKVLGEIERTVKVSGTAIVLVNNNESVFLKSHKRYEKVAQNKKGYLSGLMDKEKIKNYLVKKGFSATYVASNPLHSAFNHLLGNDNRMPDGEAGFILFNYLANADINAAVTEKASRMFSDHFMIKAIKKQ